MLDWVEGSLTELRSSRHWERERWGEVAKHLLVSAEEDLVAFLSAHHVGGALFKALVDRADFPAALQVAAQQLNTEESDRPELANILRDAGQLEMARQLTREGPDNWANWHWLASHYGKPKERTLALECWLRCWALRQDLDTYFQIAFLSKALKTWPQVGPQLIAQVPSGWLRVQVLTQEKPSPRPGSWQSVCRAGKTSFASWPRSRRPSFRWRRPGSADHGQSARRKGQKSQRLSRGRPLGETSTGVFGQRRG